MSEKMEAVATSEAPAALGAYSQAVKANGFEFVSGQLGSDPTTGEDFKEVDAVYAQEFIGSVKPARVAFGNNMIPKGALVEIDAIAVL